MNTARIGLWVIIGMGAGFCLTAAAGDFTLVSDGEAVASIVLPASPTEDEELAAKELSTFVKRMSGAKLAQVAADGAGPKLFLGRIDACTGNPPEAKLGAEQYLIETSGKDLYVLGGSSRAVLWATYGLLHEVGCRWYMPGPMGESIPQRKTVVVDGERRIEGPDFTYRQVWYSWGGPPDGGKRFAEWQRRNRLAHPFVQHGHNLTNSMPPEASFEERPELYALRDGARVPAQVCTSDPEAIRLITQTVNAFFDEHPEYLCYSLCPDDNTDFCQCERCRALDTGEVNAEGRPVVSDRLITFVNAVAEGIQERHPGKMVSTYAYVNHSKPPTRVQVSPHVVIFFTTSMYCGGHGIGDSHCASRMVMKADLEGWCKQCPNVYIYEYDPIPGNAELCWPLFGARCREMPLYRTMGLQGVSMESHCSWATLSPNHWVTAQCLWDADLTEDELLSDFCSGFFGPAAAPMRRFFEALEGALARFERMIEWGTRDIPDIYPRQEVETCRKELDAALQLAEDSDTPEQGVLRDRLHMMDLGFRYLEAYLEARRGIAEGASYAEVKAAFGQCSALIDEMVEVNPDYIEVNSCRPAISDEMGQALGMGHAEELGLVTAWNAVGPFDNAEKKGHDRVFPPEQGIDLSATYEGLTGPVTWKVISTLQGQGYVDLLHHFSPKDWVTVYALGFIHAEAAVDAQLRMGSNDTLKVWFDGKPVWSHAESRRAQLDEDIVPVHIRAGVTPVLLKISQTGRNWGFYFRITGQDGEPLSEVRVTLEP